MNITKNHYIEKKEENINSFFRLIKEYFNLQYLLINRRLREDHGLPPFVAYMLFAVAFIGFSTYLFHKSTFAEYIYALICIYFISNFSGKQRNDFLKICFKYNDYKISRIFENLAAMFPFIVFLFLNSVL